MQLILRKTGCSWTEVQRTAGSVSMQFDLGLTGWCYTAIGGKLIDFEKTD
jgi:hypothetical protein